MQPKCFVQLGDTVPIEDRDPGADSLDAHGADVVGGSACKFVEMAR